MATEYKLNYTGAEINKRLGMVDEALSTANVANQKVDALSDMVTQFHSGIVDTATGETISISDSSNMELHGLTLYGKTTQAGTPTPDNPVELVSVGASGAIKTTVTGKNVSDISTPKNGYYSDGNGSFLPGTVNEIGFLVLNVLPNTTYTISCNLAMYTVWEDDGTNPTTKWLCNNLYNRTITTGATTKRLRVSVNNTSGVADTTAFKWFMINFGDTVEPYEPYKGQTLTAQTPNGLPGIPVSSGGNYTDGNGQQWICDEVDFEKGVYVQRILQTVFNSSDGWSVADADGNKRRFYNDAYRDVLQSAKDNYSKANLLCSNFLSVTGENTWFGITGINISNSGRIFLYHGDIAHTEEALGEYFTNYPTTFMAELAQENHIPLSEIAPDAFAQYAALHTNKPITTVYNDAGAGMKLEYVADTKLYIDKKFNQLEQALLSTGSNI